jgi:hypothetical protein
MPIQVRLHCFTLLVFVLGSVLLVNGQADRKDSSGMQIAGKLEVLNPPPAATPVDQFRVSLQNLDSLKVVGAQPDKFGNFLLKQVTPGRYALDLPVIARIRTFALGSKTLNPHEFTLDSTDSSPMLIVLTGKKSSLFINVNGIPNSVKASAWLVADDPYLRRSAGYSISVSGNGAEFGHTPPGQYQLFVVDSL